VPEVGSLRSLPSLLREARKTFKPEWFPTMPDATLITLLQGMAPELFQDIMSKDGSTASLQVRFKETAPTLNRRRIIDGLEAPSRRACAKPNWPGLRSKPPASLCSTPTCWAA
jgi:hypothetical protein